MKSLSHLYLIAALLFVSPAVCFAHAFLDHSEPRVGSHVDQSPAQVRIWFTMGVEPDFSTISVFDSSGHAIDKNDTHGDPSDSELLSVSVPKLPPGEYRVQWKVVAEDTHKTQGGFKFIVDPPGAPSGK